jgi:hypothetical protein
MARKIYLLLAVFFLLFAATAPAEATIIDFESLNPGYVAADNIAAGFSGFDYSMGATWYTKSYAIANAPGTGFIAGVIGEVAAYGANLDHVISFSATAPFSFQGAVVTAAFNAAEELTIEGWLGTNKLHSQVFSINNASPTLAVVNFPNVDKIVFVPEYVGQNAFAIDNLQVGATVVPLPTAALLLGSGLLFGGWRVRKNLF